MGRDLLLGLVGKHNAENAVAALEAATALGANEEECVAMIEAALPVPGRLEPVQRKPFLVLVDYAHTDDGLDKALRAAREVTRGNLHVVFGCGGDRDRTKRPRMGRVGRALDGVRDRNERQSAR